MGNAPGRQYALVYIISALGICVLSLAAMFNPHVRRMELSEPSV
jgi:hypothetical protein